MDSENDASDAIDHMGYTSINDVIDDAATLMDGYCVGLRNKDIKRDEEKKAARRQAVFLSGILASYNEGDIGPGHCDEDQSSVDDD